MIDLKRFETLLRERRDALLGMNASDAEGARTVELDQSRVGRLSRMDALQAQAMSQEMKRRHETELSSIESALERIETGDYGYCLSCGEEIAVGRLEIDPGSTLCIRCANDLEKPDQ